MRNSHRDLIVPELRHWLWKSLLQTVERLVPGRYRLSGNFRSSRGRLLMPIHFRSLGSIVVSMLRFGLRGRHASSMYYE